METQLKKAIDLAEQAVEQLAKSEPGGSTQTEALRKSHVKAYSRTTASGGSIQVKEHDDSRQATPEQIKKYGLATDHRDAADDAGWASETAHRTGKKTDHERAAVMMHHAANLSEKASKAASRMRNEHAAGTWNESAKGFRRNAADHEEAAAGKRNPNIIGQATNRDNTAPAATHSFHHDGRDYSSTGKEGKSMHDGRRVREFESPLDEHRVWYDDKNNVHADSKEEADQHHKRGMYADHEADMDAADEPVKKFKKGDKVKDNFGKVHEVLSQNGNSVKTYQSGADTIHASKLHAHDDSEAKTHDDMSEKFRALAKQHYAKGTREGDATAREHIESAEYHEHEAKAARGETDKKNPHAGKNAHKLNDKMTQAYDRFHRK